MNLTIDPTQITAIRIGGTWTNVINFNVGELSFRATGIGSYPIGQGFQANDTETGDLVAGPLTAITAVRLAAAPLLDQAEATA